MKIFLISCSIFLQLFFSITFGQNELNKIIIIKADDVKNITQNWNKFFSISKEKGIKVSAGIICNSIDSSKKDYINWLEELNNSGMVEFWNHGLVHKRWDEKGVRIFEFSGTDYNYQKLHFYKAQKTMEAIFGEEPIAFGAPYNSLDSITLQIINENSKCRVLFSYSDHVINNGVVAKMNWKGELDGVGKPNFEKFKKEYFKKNINFSALQFHPNNFKEKHFSEYEKIIDFLISEGWSFLTPSEYISLINTNNNLE